MTIDHHRLEKLHGAPLSAPGPASMPTPAYDFPSAKVVEPRSHRFRIAGSNGQAMAGQAYRITTPDGVVHRGVTGADGYSDTIKSGYAKELHNIVLETDSGESQ